MEFPIYRKYSNNKSFFKVLGLTTFEELKFMGSKVERYFFEAQILPERNFINDMIAMRNGSWVESDESEFNSIRSKVAV